MAAPETQLNSADSLQQAAGAESRPSRLSSIAVTVRSRRGIVFEGVVSALTSHNETGEFDILANHANFVSVIKESVLLRHVERAPEVIPITVALLVARENKVEIYAGTFLAGDEKAPNRTASQGGRS